MLALLKLRLPEVLRAVAPLMAVVCVLQFALVGASAALFLQFLAGSSLAIAGMLLLFTGIDLGILPMGRFIGAELPRKGSLPLIAVVGLALGFATTLAEPDVLVLSAQVEAASQGEIGAPRLGYLIAIGVGLFTAIGLIRIVRGFSMAWLLTAIYTAALVLAWFAPPAFVPMAFDAGSVTTGVLTAPVVLAVALGLTSVLAARSSVSDGFGLLGLASVGPIIAVLLMALLLR